jgi:hypothetical protein
LIKNEANGKVSPLRNPVLAQNMSPNKFSDAFINQIMRPPKITNYEQLKRPKTNRENVPRAHLTKYKKSEFELNS